MKDCPPDKILNPSTNRCVLKTGAIGKKLLMMMETRKPKKPQKSKKIMVKKLFQLLN